MRSGKIVCVSMGMYIDMAAFLAGRQCFTSCTVVLLVPPCYNVATTYCIVKVCDDPVARKQPIPSLITWKFPYRLLPHRKSSIAGHIKYARKP